MKLRRFICAVTSLAMTMSVCAAVTPLSPVAHAASGTVVRLDPSNASPFNDGKFEGWGTSMGWWGNRVGHSDKMAQQAAEDLYSEDGLSLDIARYNVGGGDNPTHNHITRSDSKLPCFAEPLYEGGTYQASGDNSDVTNFKKDANGDVEYTWNWDADHDQLNVLKRIKEQNPNVHIEGYTNSPPWFMTNSQCSSGGDDIAENLDPSNYDVFANFLAEVAKHMKEIGLPFDSYSPMNEPEPKSNYWRALSPKQEGNLVAPGEHQSGVLKATKDAFVAAGLSDIIVAGMDETDLGYTISSFNALTADGKASLDRLDTHTYGGSNRAGVKAIAENAGLNLWMSEVDGNWNGFGLADRIIADLNGMQASAWVLWDLVDFHKDSKVFQYPEGSGTFPEANASLNVTGTMWGMGMGNHDTEEIEWANKYYAYGQFTKYINPGDTLIASSNSTLAAYNRQTGDIKIVVNNSGSGDVPYEFDMSAFRYVGSTVKEIRSNNQTGSNAEHWKEITGEATISGKTLTTTAKAGTITTYVVSGPENFADEWAIITGGGSEINVNASVQLTLNTNIKGDITWAVDNDSIAYVSSNGLVTAKKSGTVTVSATVGGYTITKTFVVPSYKLSGTPSWNNDSNAPKDSDDYRKAADGDLNTYFDGQQNGYVMYDYGSIYKVSEIKLAARSGSGMPERTVGGKVQGSNDAINWTDLYTITSAIPAGSYTTVTADQLANNKAYRYYRYTNPSEMTNIAEFLIDGTYPEGITMYTATESGLAYSYKLPDEYFGYDAFFAVHDGNRLKYASANKPAGSASGDFQGLTPKLYIWDNMEPKGIITDISNAVSGEPIVTDITEFTDDFEGGSNIFGAPAGDLSSDGNKIYASNLERFGNVFVPIKSTGTATLNTPITLTAKDIFRMKFNMFTGWENNGKDNTFAIKDASGNEIFAIKLTGGGYNLNEVRIGGTNVLTSSPVSQSRCAPGSSKSGANGWGESQTYQNNVGYNKTVEILIDGTGKVSLSFTGGLNDTTAEGTIGVSQNPITIGSIELTGDYNSARNRVAAYDNFDTDLITYPQDFEKDPEPEPTNAPVMPADGTLISLNFDNGDLTSGSTYGKASGSPVFTEVDGRKVAQLNGSGTVITLTDANGNSLLAGQDEITVSYSFKPSNTSTSWWFFAAPNNDTQVYQQEHYIGALTNNGMTVERYNGGARAKTNTGTIKSGAWNDVMIVLGKDNTDLYINGELASSVASSFTLPAILGANPVTYIGRANWSPTEYANGYIDDFVIRKGAVPSALADIDLGDLDAVKDNLTLPTVGGVTWSSSNTDIIANDGTVARPKQTTTVTLTASLTENGATFTRKFAVVVVGTDSSAYLFVHFVGTEENANCEQIYFSVSQTGTTWKTLNGGKPVLTSTVGTKGVRDPYIMRSKDNDKFYIIATDLSIYNNKRDWGAAQRAGSKSIVVWESDNIADWSGSTANLREVGITDAGCVWAPEAVYDSAKDEYMVFWASRINTSDGGLTPQRVYRSYTKDFVTFSDPEIYISADSDTIDTTIVEEDGVYYRFTKDETHSTVTMMQSTSLDGPWTDVSGYTLATTTGYEGPTIYKNADGTWTLLLDYYSKSEGYKPFVTDDISTGNFVRANDFTFDAKYRHGTVIPVTQAEYDALVAKYPKN